MSRSGYSEDCDDNWQLIMFRGRVSSAIRGRRGQAFFVALRDAMDAMPVKELIADDLEAEDGAVCALGALGKARGVDLSKIDPDDSVTVAATFDIAEVLAREVVYMNDEWSWGGNESPSARWQRMRQWVQSNIKEALE